MSAAGATGPGPLPLAVPVAAAGAAVTLLSLCCLPIAPGYQSYTPG
jgi:cytochrome c biogenesis protein CcdA